MAIVNSIVKNYTKIIAIDTAKTAFRYVLAEQIAS